MPLAFCVIFGALSISDVALVAQYLFFYELKAPNFAFKLFYICLQLWSLFFIERRVFFFFLGNFNILIGSGWGFYLSNFTYMDWKLIFVENFKYFPFLHFLLLVSELNCYCFGLQNINANNDCPNSHAENGSS